jgi:dihydrofolate reductase
MRNLILYIATSIDGFIARSDGRVDWLESVPNPNQLDYGYAALYESVDTTLMGNETYKTILAFSSDQFPYADKTNYVFSRQPDVTDTQYVRYVTDEAVTFVTSLKQQAGKDIWLVGGAQLNATLLAAGLIDKMIVSIAPVVLGNGISLFGGEVPDATFTLQKNEVFDTGFVQLTYTKES